MPCHLMTNLERFLSLSGDIKLNPGPVMNNSISASFHQVYLLSLHFAGNIFFLIMQVVDSLLEMFHDTQVYHAIFRRINT